MSSGDVQHAYSSSALRSLDQSPPRLIMAHRFKAQKHTLNHTSVSKADQSMNWRRRVDFHVEAVKSNNQTINQANNQSIEDLIQESHVEAVNQANIEPSNLARSGSQSGLTAALLSRRSSTDQSINQAINETINQSLSATQTISQSISQAVIDENQELLGRAGDSAMNAAFIVRSKLNGQLSIFKPADGEMTLEQMQAIKQSANRTINQTQAIKPASHSPSSSSEPPTPLSPGSPEALMLSTINQTTVDPALQTRTPLRKGVVYGETALKEAAAFLLDDGFSGVPETTVATLMVPRDPSTLPVIDPTSIIATNNQRALTSGQTHSPSTDHGRSTSFHDEINVPRSSAMPINQTIKQSINQSLGMSYDESVGRSSNHSDYVPRFGSLSAFVPHLTSADEMGPSLFSVDDVHKIGVLDIRLLNLDRHLGNILVSKEMDPALNKSVYKLHPIDHGYILPSYSQLSDVRFEWTNWRQTFVPFSPKTLEYIAGLDPIRDCLKLQALGVKFESLIALVFSTLLLQRGAAAGLCLHDIAVMCQRSARPYDSDCDSDEEEDSEPSVLEKIVAQVLQTFAHSNASSSTEQQTPVVQLIHSPTLQGQHASPTSSTMFSPLSSDSVNMQRCHSSIDPTADAIKRSNSVTCIKPIQNVPFDSTTVRLLLATMSDAIDAEIVAVQRQQESSRSLMR